MARCFTSGFAPIAATALAVTFTPAATADRKHPAPIEYVSVGQGGISIQADQTRQNSGVPKPSSAATYDEWRGPVTQTKAVQLPASRERVNFSYPGSGEPSVAPQRQYASVESSPLASQPSAPTRLWPAEASASPLDASKSAAVSTLTLGDSSGTSPQAAISQPVSPKASGVPHEERGLASWYGEAFHGQPTANGEIFDMYAMTAAHRTLPLPSLVQVVNERNGKEIVVRVNDRGPFEDGRIIDLSKKAADALGFSQREDAPVVVRYLGPAPALPSEQFAKAKVSTADFQQSVPQSEASSRMNRPDLYGDMLLGAYEPSLGVPDPGKSIATPARLNTKPQSSSSIVPADINEESLPPLQPYSASAPVVRTVSASATPVTNARHTTYSPQIYVQIGAFADIGNAQGRHAQVGGMFPVKVEDVEMHGADYFRVIVGPFPTRDAAERARVQLRTRGIDDSFVALR